MKFPNAYVLTAAVLLIAFKLIVLGASDLPVSLQKFIDAKDSDAQFAASELLTPGMGGNAEICIATWLDGMRIFKDNSLSSMFWNQYYAGADPENIPWWIFIKDGGEIVKFFELENSNALPLALSSSYLESKHVPVPETFNCLLVSQASLKTLHFSGRTWLYLTKI